MGGVSFTWEDGADEYAALVTTWWGGGYATAGLEVAERGGSKL